MALICLCYLCGFSLFERALDDAGLEFRSDKLWEMYISWLKERGSRESVGKVTSVLDRLLQTPTQHYKRHFTTSVFISVFFHDHLNVLILLSTHLYFCYFLIFRGEKR